MVECLLEVSSPVGLPKGMTVVKLHKAHRSLPVNPLLAQAMFLRGYKAGGKFVLARPCC